MPTSMNWRKDLQLMQFVFKPYYHFREVTKMVISVTFMHLAHSHYRIECMCKSLRI